MLNWLLSSLAVLQKMRGATQNKCDFLTVAAGPGGCQASTVCQSITQEHAAFVTNWKTNIFHSCSSSALLLFPDNPHNNLGGECSNTVAFSWCSAVVDIGTNATHSFTPPKKAEPSKCHKGSENSFNCFLSCVSCVQFQITTPVLFACGWKVVLCQSLPADRLLTGEQPGNP